MHAPRCRRSSGATVTRAPYALGRQSIVGKDPNVGSDHAGSSRGFDAQRRPCADDVFSAPSHAAANNEQMTHNAGSCAASR